MFSPGCFFPYWGRFGGVKRRTVIICGQSPDVCVCGRSPRDPIPNKGQENVYFPTCQVRVVRFYQRCSPPPPPPPPHPPPPSPPRSPDPSGHCRTSTASSRSQWALPDLPGCSGHCRTSTATSRSQWALPDLNRDFQIAVGTAGPQPRLPDRSGHCRTSTATSRSQWALPDLNGKNVRKDVR